MIILCRFCVIIFLCFFFPEWHESFNFGLGFNRADNTRIRESNGYERSRCILWSYHNVRANSGRFWLTVLIGMHFICLVHEFYACIDDVQYCIVQYSAAQYFVQYCIVVQYSALQYGIFTVLYSIDVTVHYIAVLYCTLQYLQRNILTLWLAT